MKLENQIPWLVGVFMIFDEGACSVGYKCASDAVFPATVKPEGCSTFLRELRLVHIHNHTFHLSNSCNMILLTGRQTNSLPAVHGCKNL